MNTFDTPRWKHLIEQLGARTRIGPNDVKVLDDTEVQCEVEMTVRQRAGVERSREAGHGRSEATLLPDVALLGPAAEDESQQLAATLPERARKWLAAAPNRLRSLPTRKDFDFDVQRYGVDSGCEPCEKSGKVSCTRCLRGRVQCPQCDGVKRRMCAACGGSCSTRCGACGGAGNSRCGYCSGTAHWHCESCNRSGQATCNGCGGRGYHQRYQQVQKDIGKGPFYETVEVRESCWTCRQTGKVNCTSCGGMPVRPCNHCSGGVKTCDACNGRGQVSCASCGQTGTVTCNACDAVGQTGCTNCNATALVNCQPCGARGWTHVRENIFTRLVDDASAQWSAATPTGLIDSLNSMVVSADAEKEGSFRLQHQEVSTTPSTSLTRSWKGTVPAWTMQFEVEGKPLALHAVGKSQQLVGMDVAVEQVLAADREGLLAALKQGGSTARRAVQRYLRSVDHVSGVLEVSKQPTSSAREDLQAVSAYLARQAEAAQAAWRWSARAVAALPCVPVLLGFRIRFDLLLLLILPLVIVGLGRFAQRRAALRAAARASGHKSFADSWQQLRQQNHPTAYGNKAVLLWGCVLAALALWVSPAKPLLFAYASSELQMKATALPIVPNQAEARTALLEDWMACRSQNVDGLLTALSTLPTQTPSPNFDAQSFQRGIREKTWRPTDLELTGRKVQQLTLRATVLSGIGNLEWLAFEARLNPSTDDPKKMIQELGKTPVAASENMLSQTRGSELSGTRSSWSAVMTKSQGFGKNSRPGPSSLVVTCQYRPGDWLRLAR